MKRILIVDDSSVMRKNLRLILSREGYDIVAEATNGEEARRVYAALRPDLVTMDITMPVMNGIDAVKAITKEYPEARIIVISAFDQRSMLFEAMENGARHYIIKPITAEKLVHAVRQVLEAAAGNGHGSGTAMDPGRDSESDSNGRLLIGDNGTAPPQLEFCVENRNGAFVMKMPGPDLGEHLPKARQALQGLLFIRPLTVEFAITGTEHLSSHDLESLLTMAGQIHHAGGSLTLSGDRAGLIHTLRNALPGVPVMEQPSL